MVCFYIFEFVIFYFFSLVMARVIKGRNWVFTIHAEQGVDFVAEHPLREQLASEKVKSYCYQLEKCPETGRLHLQGYLNVRSPCTLATIKKILNCATAHLETAKSPKDAWKYCSKQESRISGPWMLGEPQGSGKRNDLEKLWNDLKQGKKTYDIIDEDPRMANRGKPLQLMRFALQERESDRQLQGIKTNVLVGPAGSGKTYAAINILSKGTDYFILENPSRKGDKLWFDGYEGQKTLILDDFSGSDTCSFAYLKRLLDIYKLRVEVKGGFTWAAWTNIIITSNEDPISWYNWDNEGNSSMQALQRRITDIRHCEEPGRYRLVDWSGNPTSDFLNYENI